MLSVPAIEVIRLWSGRDLFVASRDSPPSSIDIHCAMCNFSGISRYASFIQTYSFIFRVNFCHCTKHPDTSQTRLSFSCPIALSESWNHTKTQHSTSRTALGALYHYDPARPMYLVARGKEVFNMMRTPTLCSTLESSPLPHSIQSKHL